MMRSVKLLIKEDFEIKNYTSFKIGGKIKKVYFPETIEEFAQILKDEPNIFVGGNWSNTLVSSYGYAYSVVSTLKLDKIEEQRAGGQKGKSVTVESGKWKVESLSSHAPSPDGEGWDGVISNDNSEYSQEQPTDTNFSTLQPFNPSNENSLSSSPPTLLSSISPHPNPPHPGRENATTASNFPFSTFNFQPTVKVCAGVKGPKLAQTVAEYGLSGLEFMIGFPGSVGGEVFMNAGAHGQSISDVLKSAKIFDGKKIITLTKDEMEFSYRHSICQDKNYIVLEAEFELTPDNPDKIKQKMAENLEFRKNHQPSLSLPNCGSIFRNPENNSAGKLLDECGVKGLQIGGAKVWENHANFIVNTGNATSTDVLQLMLEMKNRVKEKFNIELIPEIKFLGNNKNEVELC